MGDDAAQAESVQPETEAPEAEQLEKAATAAAVAPREEPVPDNKPILHFRHVDVYYGPIQVLYDVDYEVFPGEIVALLGSNGAGKTTTMKTILGIVRPRRGEIDFQGRRIDDLSTPEIVKFGVAPVPEGRRIFGRLTVQDNLRMGAYVRSDRNIGQDTERVYDLFPRLKERRYQIAGTMSGGEQQMLAIGRALMANPSLLIMDEPSMGLSPILVERVFDTIQTINQQGTTIFMVEQNAFMALTIADRGYVLRSGHIVLQGKAKELLESDQVRREYLGA
jgi:branched-chain amino acid transport system ATP-binding protein